MKTFCEDYARFRNDPAARPETIVILDEKPAEQPLYSEMQVFAALFRAAGIEAVIVDPEAIEARGTCLYFDGKPVEMIYNRHCDFYRKRPAEPHSQD
jgi:hypothetical protein